MTTLTAKPWIPEMIAGYPSSKLAGTGGNGMTKKEGKPGMTKKEGKPGMTKKEVKPGMMQREKKIRFMKVKIL